MSLVASFTTSLRRRRAIAAGLAAAALVVISSPHAVCADQEDDAARSERPITPEDRAHWSFRPLVRPELPAPEGRGSARNEIDLFVLDRLEREGLEPLPEAGRRTLIRRLSFDLTGLPPAREEIERFLGDTSPNAYERLVDRYLDSPGYAEEQARLWLDLARFAESDGFEHDNARPNAWRYRDWVIRAIAADLPYDEFVELQIAGDLLRPNDPWAAVATGFGLCGPDMPDINLQEERRHMVLNDLTATVGSVFLGLSFACAQCHDHKTDPVSQADFYRLRAYFDDLALFRDWPLPSPAKLEPAAGTSDADEPPRGRVFRVSEKPVGASHVRIRGAFDRLGPEVRPAPPRIVDSGGETRNVRRTSASETVHPRVELARWLVRPDHPLAMRVIANRIWQSHFGRGIVRTPSDFGHTGEPPDDPRLLDWLATELPRRGFSLRSLHREIVTSATYRRASRPDDDEWSEAERARAAKAWRIGRERDATNRFWWRRDRRRLEAEAIRDAVLSVAGRLSRRQGGRGVMAPLPEEIRRSIRKDHWTVDPDPVEHHRRSIYLFVRRNLRYPLLEVFDRPDTNATCPRRAETVTAPQALALLHSPWTFESAEYLAGHVVRECGAGAVPSESIAALWRRVLGRPPAADESSIALEFLANAKAATREKDGSPAVAPVPACTELPSDEGAALVLLAIGLLNSNEFVWID